MTEAFKLSVKMGMPSDEFWRLTPWLFRIHIEAFAEKIEDEHRMRAWHTWHGALLSRLKKLPSFKEFVDGKSSRSTTNPDEIKKAFRAYQDKNDQAKKRKAKNEKGK